MRVIAEGCGNCEPLVAPERTPPTESHATANDGSNVWCFIDGGKAMDVYEAWAGSPGRVIRYPQPLRLCPCTPAYRDNEPTWDEENRRWVESVNDPQPFRQLIEYDLVELRRVSP